MCGRIYEAGRCDPASNGHRQDNYAGTICFSLGSLAVSPGTTTDGTFHVVLEVEITNLSEG
jgi:hypothetical protein